MPNGSEPYTHVDLYQMLTGYRLVQWIDLQILDFDLEFFTIDDRNQLASKLISIFENAKGLYGRGYPYTWVLNSQKYQTCEIHTAYSIMMVILKYKFGHISREISGGGNMFLVDLVRSSILAPFPSLLANESATVKTNEFAPTVIHIKSCRIFSYIY